MTCRSFRNYRNPKVPEDDDGPPNQMRVYSWFHRCSGGNPPLINLDHYFADAADEFVDGGVKSKQPDVPDGF